MNIYKLLIFINCLCFFAGCTKQQSANNQQTSKQNRLAKSRQANVRKISGTITDMRTKKPIEGATIYAQNKIYGDGDLSKADGKFAMKAAPSDTLVISFRDFHTKRITVGKSRKLNIELVHTMYPANTKTLSNTKQPPPKPIVQQPKVVEVPDEEKIEEEVEVNLDVEFKEEAPVPPPVKINAPPPPPPVEEKEEAIFIVTDDNRNKRQPTKPKPKKVTPKKQTWKRATANINKVRLEVGHNVTLPLQSRQIAVRVDGFRARVLMDCYFLNDKRRQLEGTFKLRLPNGASPYFFAFGNSNVTVNQKLTASTIQRIDYQTPSSWALDSAGIMQTRRRLGNLKPATIAPKQKAADAYTQTTKRRVDPALMEWAGADIFNCRVFPLVPRRVHHIVIGYDINLLETDGLSMLDLPLGNQKDFTNLDVDVVVAKFNQLKPTIHHKVTLNEYDSYFHFRLNNPKDHQLKITYPNKHPVLLKSLPQSPSNYFATSFKADIPSVQSSKSKSHALFLLDVSLSSQPDKFNIWLKTLKATLNNNRKQIKHFSVLCFNIEAFWWKKTWVKNTPKNVARFLKYAEGLSLEGATDLSAALDEVYSQSIIANKNKHLFLLSDGDVNWGQDNLHLLRKKVKNNDQIYAFNTGLSGTNTRILAQLTRSTNGAVFSVIGEAEIAKASTAFTKRPWRIKKVSMNNASDFLLAGRPEYLYAGQKLILAGRGQLGTNPELTILLDNGQTTKTFKVKFKHQLVSELANRVYGQIATNQLEEFKHLTQNMAVKYARHFKIPAQNCSFVMLESQADYQRFGIRPQDFTEYVRKNPVNKKIQSLGNTAVLGDAKANFLNFIEKLQKMRNGRLLNLNPSTLAMIQNAPISSFEVATPKLNCKEHKRKASSKQLQDILKAKRLNYDMLTFEAEQRRTTYSPDDALKLLSSLVERNAGNTDQLRDIAFSTMTWKLDKHSYFIFKKIIELRAFVPQTYQMIAQTLHEMGKDDLAMWYYEIAVQANWDSDYRNSGPIAQAYYLNFLQQTIDNKWFATPKGYRIKRISDLRYKLQHTMYPTDKADLVVTLTWNTDNTDIDLYVEEASGEECYYSHRLTRLDGRMTPDMTRGFGPEMYVLKNAPKGTYKAKVNLYGSNRNQFKIRNKAYLTVVKHWGKPNQQIIKKIVTLKKTGAKTAPLVEVTF